MPVSTARSSSHLFSAKVGCVPGIRQILPSREQIACHPVGVSLLSYKSRETLRGDRLHLPTTARTLFESHISRVLGEMLGGGLNQ
jgi:hypothetical protein